MMPPQRPPSLNPLGAISSAQPAPSTKTIDDLRLTELKQKLINSGALNTATRKQSLANVGSMRNKIIGLGLDPDDPDVMKKVAAIGVRNRVQQQGVIATGLAGRGFGTELTPGTTPLTMDLLEKPLGEIRSPEVRAATAGLSETESLEEKRFRSPRPGEVNVGQSIPQKFTSTRQVKTKGDPGRGFRLPNVLVRPQQQAAPPPKAVSKKQAKGADRVYGTVGDKTGWWVRNPKTGGYNLEE